MVTELGKPGGAETPGGGVTVTPALASFGDWVEQLIAESTGKEGKGILPVAGEELPGAAK